MSTTTSKSLDTDFYRASVYEEEENTSHAIYKQLLILIAIIAIFILAYIYLIKNNTAFISSFWEADKASIVITDSKAVQIIDQQVEQEKIVKVMEVKEKESVVPIDNIKREVKEEDISKKSFAIRAKVGNEEVLTAEYIKQVQESLGNY